MILIKLWYIIQSFFFDDDSEKWMVSSHSDSGKFIHYICYVHIIVISAAEDSKSVYQPLNTYGDVWHGDTGDTKLTLAVFKGSLQFVSTASVKFTSKTCIADIAIQYIGGTENSIGKSKK